MILKALYDYYHRCRKLYSDEMPALGFERVTMDYVVVIKEDGTFANTILSDYDCIAPRAVSNKTGTKAPANILWDSAKYMLNAGAEDIEDPSDHCKMIIEMATELSAMFPDRKDFCALLRFYQKKEYKKLEKHVLAKKLFKSKAITFMLKGEPRLVCSESTELEEYISHLSRKNPKGICLVTGKEANIFLTSGGVPLGMAKNGKLVSFMEDKGYDSHGKKQGENAPISIYAEYAYTAAIKRLTRSEKSSLNIKGKADLDKTLVFWSSATDKEKSEVLETKVSLFAHLAQDNPDDVDSVKAFFSQVKKEGVTGIYGTETYYFLELVPTTKGRIAISFWNECSVKDFADIVLRHMDAMSIETNRKIKYDALNMVNSVSLCKIDDKGLPNYDRLPNLIDSVFRSIFTGTPYPEVLFKMCLNRINAEQSRPNSKSEPREYGRFENRDAERAAIIKAYLYRNLKQNINNMLNTEINDRGYLCGRLFAVLERTQEVANHETGKEWKSDLRSKYMNAAMTTPATVFPAILANSNYYLDKIPSIGWIEELKQEIIGKFEDVYCFPSILSMEEQGSFFIGYYQQRQTFFPKDNQTEPNE